MLQGRQPHPGGKVPAALEHLGRWCENRQGDCGHWTNPGNGHEPTRCLIRLGPLGDLTIQKHNLLVQPVECVDQDLEDRSGNLREKLIRVRDRLHELSDMSWPFGYHDAELGQMPAQGIDGLGPLPHQEIACPEHESGGLGLLAFGSHEAHGRALGRLADRLSIRGIVLLALHERLT
jgi:hypothetical protein